MEIFRHRSRFARAQCRPFAKPSLFARYTLHRRRFPRSPRVLREPLRVLASSTAKSVCLEAPLFPAQVAAALIVQIQINPGDAVLVHVDPVHPPHEHKPGTTLLTELIDQRLPIRFHSSINLTAAALVVPSLCVLPACWYIALISCRSCKSWRSSSIEGGGALLDLLRCGCCALGLRAAPRRVP